MLATGAVLWGTDHVEVGTTTVEAVDRAVAIGIARGWQPKPYPYLDPNEDVTAAAVGDRATLLVVADGHRGHEASRAAVTSVLRRFGQDPPPADLTDDELLDVFHAAGEAVQVATTGLRAPRGESRTTLVVALLSGDRLQWASMGDSSLFVAGNNTGVELTEDTRRFVGQPMSRREVAASLTRGVVEIDPRAWVILASDGYTDYLPAPASPADATRVWLRSVTDPVAAVKTLLDKARVGGAGDNVALAVVAPRG